MTKALARRRAPTLATRELRKRRRLTPREHLIVYLPIWVMIFGVVVSITGFVVLLGVDSWQIDLLSALAFSFGALTPFGAWGWWEIEREYKSDRHGFRSTKEGYLNVIEKRRWQVRADRFRRGRGHADDEKARLRDVPYPRYSVYVRTENGQIRLVALRHQRIRLRFHLPQLIKWQASETKTLWNAKKSEWDEETSQLAVIRPGIDEPLEKLGEAQLVAQALEDEAYAQGLKQYQLECLALTIQPPPLGARTRAKVSEGLEDDLERLLQAGSG